MRGIGIIWRVKPGASGSTMHRDGSPRLPSSCFVRATTSTSCASSTPEMNVFCPLRKNLSPSRRSDVESLCEFDPASASVIANANLVVPAAMPRSQRSFCSGVACLARMLPTIAGETTIRSNEQPRRRDLLADDRQRPQPEPAAAVLLGQVHAQVAALGERVPQLERRLAGLDLGPHVLAAELAADAADRLPHQHLLVGREQVERWARTSTDCHRQASYPDLVLPGTEDQPQARVALTAALQSEDHLSHAYLFHGPSGTGKRQAARAFAATLLARGQADTADVERRVWAGVHPDLTWVEPRGAHDILVDDVRRKVVREVALRPFEASKRVFVIADAERMNEESQNALLKTLEEPSAFAHFVLVSSAPGRLLPTIPSRCRPVRFGPVPAERIAEMLVADGADAALADACARLSGGDVGKARRLVGEGSDQRQEAEAAARATLRDTEDADWTLAEPWGPLLRRAAEEWGRRPKRRSSRKSRNGSRTSPRRVARDSRPSSSCRLAAHTAETTRRHSTTASSWSNSGSATWWRSRVTAKRRFSTRTERSELVTDAAGRDVDALIGCVDLCETARRRLERNVLEDLALESLFNRLRRTAVRS